MAKIMKYLGEFKMAVAAIILLLIVQAYCDLALPSYTSDIVDVGIEQSGIENAVPVIVRENTLEGICLFAEEEDEAFIREHYRQNGDGNYELQDDDKETIASLEEIMSVPMVMVSMLSQMPAGDTYTKEQALLMKRQILDQYGEELSDMIVVQMAVMSVKAEYEALNLDVSAMQTEYLLTVGSKMLLMTVFMMSASIAVGFLAARVAIPTSVPTRRRITPTATAMIQPMPVFVCATLIMPPIPRIGAYRPWWIK